ncbi:MAG: DpnI domain-containing protein [Candidatus Pacebacteria bacterium]|jgi:type II restriction enzyme|nr:DpnI domain-containing protein [Candidatus Paceibacterota bacterium]
MILTFDLGLTSNYKSPSQKARVLTEHWVDKSVFCPNCGHTNINKYPNNQPVADFFCPNCSEDYELKSKKNSIGNKILDGSYRTKMERLKSNNNPNLFVLNYSLSNLCVLDFFIIPKHFFVPEIIEKRKPLADSAKRAGWVGSNILLQKIPQVGKIFLVKQQRIEPKERVLADWQKTLFLRKEKEISTRGWLLDIMRCIDGLGKKEFTLDEVYAFENELSRLHPENKHIKDKIRQQLQFLRDKGYLGFVSRGYYRLT